MEYPPLFYSLSGTVETRDMLPARVKSLMVRWLLLGGLVAIGCSSQPSIEEITPIKDRLIKIGAAYTRGTQFLGHPPPRTARNSSPYCSR